MKIFEPQGYHYIKHITTGGQAEVYLIEQDGKKYIAKVFEQLDQDTFALLKHIQSLQAPNVPQIIDVYNQDDKTVLIREYIDGHTLYQEIEKNGTIDYQRATRIILKICDTLRVFHNNTPNPIVYRDLKPENILLSKEDEVYLIDFGIARYHKGESTRDTVLMGTKGYTAPEVMAGMQSDNRSDIYSIGLIFYEMLTGKNLLVPPYQIRPLQETDKRLPKRANKVIERATDISMVMRYKSVDEFVRALKKADRLNASPFKKIIYSAAIIAGIILLLFGVNAVARGGLFNRWVLFSGQNAAPEGFDIVLDLEFENPEDFEWLQLFSTGPEPMPIEDIDLAEVMMDGKYLINHPATLNHRLPPGAFCHIRVRLDPVEQNGAQFVLSLIPEFDQLAAYNIPVSNRDVIGSEIINEFGHYWEQAQGAEMIAGEDWLDIVVYLDASGETLRYMICSTENEADIAFGGIRVDESWIGREYQIELNPLIAYWEDEVGIPAPISQVEFIRIVNGDLIQYLSDHVAVYQRNPDPVNDFLNRDIAFIPQERFTEHEF